MKALLSKYKKIDRNKSAATAAIEADGGSSSVVPAAKRPRTADHSPPPTDGAFRIVFQCLEGSVTHYYHFFYGAMIPLILHHLENPSAVYRILTDIGPMKRVLCELPLNVIEFKGPEHVGALGKFHDDKSLRRAVAPGETVVQAYDAYNSEFYRDEYVQKLSKTRMRKILQFFEDTMPEYVRSIPTYEVILIERATDSYYRAGCPDRTQIYKSSGAERRSLSNHVELVATLSAKYGSKFCNIVLERSSIYYQYHMFRNAKVVIAQHGAALANIIFMSNPSGSPSKTDADRPSGTVVEISPPWSRQSEHFRNLAEGCGVAHSSILQTADHSDVDINGVMRCVEGVFKTPPAI